MKKFYFTLGMLFAGLGSFSPMQAQEQNVIKMTTAKTYGENLNLWPKTASKEETIYVDWGDGTKKPYNIDPNGMPFMTKVSGKIVGDTIRIYAPLTSLECTEEKLTSISVHNQLKMSKLILSGNELTTDKTDLQEAANVEILDLSNNDLSLLNLSEFQELQQLQCSNNPRLGAVLLPEYSEKLRSISLSKCDISHFYPANLPALESLTLGDCSLTEIEIAGHYPQLSSLDVSGNYISQLDVTQCKELETLKCGSNQLTTINVSQNPKLLNFFCENNRITALNLKNNPQMSSLSCDRNQLTSLNVSVLPNLVRLTCDQNQLTRLDLSQNAGLNRLTCSSNQLEFLDFANNPHMDFIDCRHNSRMTSCTVNYMFSTLLARYRDAYSPNLLVEGCNAEHADMSEVNSAEMKWKTDITGNGTARCEAVSLTLIEAVNGSYTLSQPTQYGKNYQTVTYEAMTGTPIKVTATPDAGYVYDYAVVNGQTISDTVFVIHKAALVEVKFKSNRFPEMTLGTAPGQALSFALSAPEENTRITIDWGDGVESSQMVGKQPKRFDGTAAGAVLKIKGEINEADFSSYPGMGLWDNQFSSLTLSNTPNLESLNLYMNPISTLNVADCPNLQFLDCSYTGLTALDVTANPRLVSLNCYGNQIETLHVTRCPDLTELNAKSNRLTTLDLSANPKLELLDVQNNQLTAVDVKQMKGLAQLYVASNRLTEIDVTQNADLYILNVADNQLKTLDLSHNPSLGKLFCADNQIPTLDLSRQKLIFYVDCQGNRMTACALTDLYYSLPEYPQLDKPLKGHTLWVKGNHAETANDAEGAESVLATGKGWTINYEGDGSGCDQAYVTILTPENGSIEVFTATGEKVLTGMKVKKNSELTVKATPDAGYATARITANGKEITDGKLTLTRSTDVAARFEVATGIGEVDSASDGCLISSSYGALNITTDQEVRLNVYTVAGKLVQQAVLNQSGQINLPAGTYVVQTVTGSKTSSQVVVVR